MQKNKLYGLVYGCALGDAVGLQYEGCDKEYITRVISTLTIKTQGYWHGVELGDWSDDTDHLVLLLETLTENNNNFNSCIFAKKLKYWRKNGFPELGDTVGMGLGQYTGRLLSDLDFEKHPIQTSKKIYEQLGSNRAPNGALMRTGIMAFSTNWAEDTILQCKTTHYDSRCIKSCLVLAYICRCFIYNHKIRWTIIKNILDDFPYWSELTLDIDKVLPALNLDGEDRGYTYKSLACALYVLRIIQYKTVDFKKIMQSIIQEGGDTDTNCAISGQILGVYLGYDNLPTDWLNLLKNKKWLDAKLNKYLR